MEGEGRGEDDNEAGAGAGSGASGSHGNGQELVAREEYDFFARELDKMGWGVGSGMVGMVDEDEGVEGLVNAQMEGRSEFEGGVLQMEGWA